jgi:hypothetical protein
VGLGACAVCVACASAPLPRETRADNARPDDGWLAGSTCSQVIPQDPAFTIEEIAEGSGPAVQWGETIRVHYVAKTRDGATLHDTHDGGPPLEMIVASTKVICGFERAITGMKPGGRRRVYVPARLAFGDAGRAPDVPPKTDLVLDVELWVPADRVIEPKGGRGRAPASGGGRRR